MSSAIDQLTALWRLQDVALDGLPGRPHRLAGVTLEIMLGTTVVLGPSGAGKTSLLDLLVGFERPSAGTIIGPRRGPESTGVLIFWSPPDHGLWPQFTVRQHLELVQPQAGQALCERLLSDFQLGQLAQQYPGDLSLGERSRVAMARALASKATVLVLDEPLAHVDPARLSGFWSVVRQHAHTHQQSLIFATHDPAVAVRESTTAICIQAGRVSWSGLTTDLYHFPPTPDLAALLGPCNWFSPQSALSWLGSESVTDICLRPEQLHLRPDAQGRFEVVTSRSNGATTETQLRDLTTQEVRCLTHATRSDLSVGLRAAVERLRSHTT